MLSNKTNILQLVSLMQKHGVAHVVLCPGSRNAPIVHTVVESGAFECYTVTDERSAGFFAVGLADALDAPVAVCCTSGSALMNLAPAASEAFYRHVPLLIISADRPEMWIDQMDGQTMRQNGALASVVKRSVQLPEPGDDDERWYCNRLVNEALTCLVADGGGPVHVNVPVTEPLFDFTTAALPDERVVRVTDDAQFVLPEEMKAEWLRAKRPMIVIGQSKAGAYNDVLSGFGRNNGVVVSEVIGNIECEHAVSQADAVLSAHTDDERLCPDLVITLGGHVVSKRLKKFLRSCPSLMHWHVSPDAQMADTFQCLGRVVRCDDGAAFLQSLPDRDAEGSFLEAWRGYDAEAAESMRRFTFSSLNTYSVIGELAQRIAEARAAHLHLANSTTVRAAQLFSVVSARYHCNRGINGIDGSLSSAVGFAAAKVDKNLNIAVIGDLSFFYDQNALWNNYHDGRLRILLLNNGCGHIFHHLPGLNASPHRDDYVAAQHHTTAEGIASQTHCDYIRIDTLEQLRRHMDEFVRPERERTLIMEVMIDVHDDEEAQRMIYESFKTK